MDSIFIDSRRCSETRASSLTLRRRPTVPLRIQLRNAFGTACVRSSCFQPIVSSTCNIITSRGVSEVKIDIFNHLFPKRFWDEFINVGDKLGGMGKRVQNISHITDLDNSFRVMDEFGEYVQIISLPGPPVELMGGPDKS